MAEHNTNDLVRMMESIRSVKPSRWRKVDEHRYRRRMRGGYACSVTEHRDGRWTGQVIIEIRRRGMAVEPIFGRKMLGPFATAMEAKRATDDDAWAIGARLCIDAIGGAEWSLAVVSGKAGAE